ncbi:MAG TPA: pilus assembly protein TadG-related protein [Paracoccaceae bacterium]|nr:pilus assembly protein TadG-related protein [Paracoccaceae bacterium]
MPRFLGQYRKDESGAIAAMYALSLFGLVAIAGVGWDYGRMMAMDSELQNAADQAALAAATQLDGRDGAIARAQAAANDFLASADSDFVNITRMANDGDGRPITDLTFTFFESYDSAADTFGAETDVDADANVVLVTVNGREAFFALTPIVGLLSSGGIAADAVAGLEAAACNVPPLMFCAPSGNANFPAAGDIGSALDLREKPQNTAEFTPGNFDLLQIEYEGIAPSEQNNTLGLNSDFLGCAGAEIETRPGSRTPETTAINTRFDIYPNGNQMACRDGGDFCPAELVHNNLVRRVEIGPGGGQGGGNNALTTCANATDFDLISISDVPSGITVPDQSLPLDGCQLLGSAGCLSFGDGVWNLEQYMQNVHGIASGSASGLDGNGDGQVTRFEVYNWERADSSRRLSREFGRTTTTSPATTTLYCSNPTPSQGTPVIPSGTQKDRRIVTVASVDCTGQGGRFAINTIRWVDLFLLGPATGSAGSSEIRAEIVGPAQQAGGGTGFQFFGRNKPVLLR